MILISSVMAQILHVPTIPSSWNYIVVLYADDILLVTFSITELQRLFDACQRELCWLDMRISMRKILLYSVFELDQDVIQYVLV